MAIKIKQQLLVPVGLFAGAAVLGVALYIYNKIKKNSNVSNANVSDGSITASNVVYGGGGGGSVGSIVAQNQSLTTVTAGTTGNNISLAALTVSNCAENANRTIMLLGVGITLKKNGIPLAVNGTFIATDILTFDVASNVAATTAKGIFEYKANGVCGDSNIATISANIIAAGAATISVVNQSLSAVNAGTSGNAVAFTTPTVVNSCVFSGSRTLVSFVTGITVKKNGNPMAVNDTWLNADAITYDVANTVLAATAKELFRYRAVGTCGNSNDAIMSANITVSALTAFTFKDAWLNGATYENYASLVDAMDKNFENSGFTNRTATLYTTSMNTNNIAYSNAGGTILYPQGNYFDDTNFRYFSINAQGIMFLFGDEDNSGLNPINIKLGY